MFFELQQLLRFMCIRSVGVLSIFEISFPPQNLKLPEDQKCVGNRLSAARLLGLGSSQSFCTMFLRLDPTVQSRYSEISRRDYLPFLTSDRKMSRAALEAKNLSMGLKKNKILKSCTFRRSPIICQEEREASYVSWFSVFTVSCTIPCRVMYVLLSRPLRGFSPATPVFLSNKDQY